MNSLITQIQTDTSILIINIFRNFQYSYNINNQLKMSNDIKIQINTFFSILTEENKNKTIESILPYYVPNTQISFIENYLSSTNEVKNKTPLFLFLYSYNKNLFRDYIQKNYKKINLNESIIRNEKSFNLLQLIYNENFYDLFKKPFNIEEIYPLKIEDLLKLPLEINRSANSKYNEMSFLLKHEKFLLSLTGKHFFDLTKKIIITQLFTYYKEPTSDNLKKFFDLKSNYQFNKDEEEILKKTITHFFNNKLIESLVKEINTNSLTPITFNDFSISNTIEKVQNIYKNFFEIQNLNDVFFTSETQLEISKKIFNHKILFENYFIQKICQKTISKEQNLNYNKYKTNKL